MYSFSFEAGSAVVRSDETGEIMVNQPFNPTSPSQAPWADAAEAEAFVKAAFPQFFYDPGLEPWDGTTLPPPEGEEVPVEPSQGA